MKGVHRLIEKSMKFLGLGELREKNEKIGGEKWEN